MGDVAGKKDPVTGRPTYEHFTDYKARMGNSNTSDGRYYGSKQTAFHEVMHLFGLKDWYKTDADRNFVGPNDMMNKSYAPEPKMHQTHWNSWRQAILNQSATEQNPNKFILNHWVE